jgi:DNA-binding XRE family transcriptional regulator
MPVTKKPGTNSAALTYVYKKYYAGSRKRQNQLQAARTGAAVARKICELRIQAGLSQRELARLVGTTASVICRLEDDDYDGHSLTMLYRIAAALNQRVDIRFVPVKAPRGS